MILDILEHALSSRERFIDTSHLIRSAKINQAMKRCRLSAKLLSRGKKIGIGQSCPYAVG
jgi:hypothetical protein